jgi:alpha-galactosidase
MQNLALSLGLVGFSGASPAWKIPRESNGVGVAPALRFNNWNAGLPSSAATALTAANAFMSLGLKDFGYEYINTDDTWSNMSRVNGLLSSDNTKWPNGIVAMATKIHRLGLKFGLYTDSGTATCSRLHGSEGYETTGADTLTGLGVHF